MDGHWIVNASLELTEREKKEEMKRNEAIGLQKNIEEDVEEDLTFLNNRTAFKDK